MKRRLLLSLFAAASIVSPAWAQPGSPGQKPGEDQLAKFFFSPELVLQYAQDLALQPEQRTAIVNAVKEAQGDIFDLQLRMAERNRELMKVLGGPFVPLRDLAQGKTPGPERLLDETAVLVEVDRILAVERDMKHRQMQLLIRIRNALTREQQEKLALWRDNPRLFPRGEGERF